MSSTNRGSERVEKDSYPTPAWCVERLLEYTRPVGNVWLEPCVGDGAIARVLTRLLNTPREFIGVDIRDTRANALASGCTDFLHGCYQNFVPPAGGIDSIITNPPYSLSFDICQKVVTQAPWVALLLPLNFASSAKRCAWFRANTPSVLVLPDRPSFVRCYSCQVCFRKWVEALDQERKTECKYGCKLVDPCDKLQICESDSNDYGWFVWDGRPPTFAVLNTTPLEVRRPNGRSK